MGNTISDSNQKNITMTPEQYKQYVQYLKQQKILKQRQRQEANSSLSRRRKESRNGSF